MIDPGPDPHLTPTIFHEPWWLEAASEGAWREATAHSGGSLVGRLPYLKIRKATRQTVLVMPAMTHTLGPAIGTVSGGAVARTARQLAITRELVDQLPPASYVWFKLHGGTPTTLAFDAAGFSNGVHYTIEIAPEDPASLWRKMRDKARNVIRRAQEGLTVGTFDRPEAFLDFYVENLRARKLRNAYDRGICTSLISEAVGRGRGDLLVASDASGVPKAGIFTIRDRSSEYYHMSTRAPDATNGATSLLLWTAIQSAARRGLTFDMDGVTSRRSLLFLTGFGGVLAPRFTVCRSSASFRLARQVGSLASAIRRPAAGDTGLVD